ncbi:unnamed protein product [Rhizoctonia solani]|nr:unnamed protein product [Rhizoctonia solani]
MPPRRATRASAEPQPVSRKSSRGKKSTPKAEPIVIESDSESDGFEEIAPPSKPVASKARRGRPPKSKVKEEPVEVEDDDDEAEVEQVISNKGKGKGKASAVVPAKRRSNRQTVGEHTDKEHTAGETTPAEDAPKRNVRRTSRQPSIAKAPLSKQTARKISVGRRKRGQEEDDEDEAQEERPNKRQIIKEEPEPQSEPEAASPEPEADKPDEGGEEEGTPVSEQPPPEPDEDSDTPAPPKNQPSKPNGKAKVNGKAPAPTHSLDSPHSPPRSKPEVKTPTQPKSQPRRSAIHDSDTEEERDLLAEVAATPLRPKLGPRESLMMSASQIQQLSSQGAPQIVLLVQCVLTAEKEKSKLEAEKQEAEAFLRDQNDLVRAQSKLWQFNTYKCKQNIEATQSHIGNLQAELATEVEANAGYIRETEELETQYKEQREAFDVLERELAKINKSLNTQSKVEVGLEEKQKHIKSKEKKLQKSIVDDTHQKNEADTWIVNHTEQIEKSTKEIAKLEKELVVEEKQLEVIAESVKGKTQKYHDQIQAKQAELVPCQRKIAEREGALNVATREREMLESKAKAAEQAVEEVNNTIQTLSDEHEVKTTELETAKSERDKLSKELQGAEKTLRDMTSRVDKLKGSAASNRSKRDEAKASNAQNSSRNAVLDSLMKLKESGRIQGFHGRLGNLGTIPDEYDVAVTTAAGGLNNMVVDTVEQAQACIEFLRKNNVGRAQFYVLEKLTVNSRNMERIQTPHNTPRLFDLITMKEKKFAPAFYMAMRDTLVAPDLDSGEKIAFSESGKRWRVVTKDGKLIDLSGTMSGGGTRVSRGGMSSKFAAESVSPDVIRRYEAESEKAEQEYSEALAEMRTFERGVEDMRRRVPAMNTAVSKLEMDIQNLEARIKDAEKKLRTVQNENKLDANDAKRTAALAKEIASIESELTKIRAKAASYEKDIADLEEQILEVGGVKLRSQTSKVDDIKGMLLLANDLLLKAETGKTRSKKDSKKYTASIESGQAALEELEEELGTLNENLQTCRADMQKLQQAVSQAEGAKDTYEDSLKELKEELDEKLKLTLSFRAKEQDLKQEIAEAEVELKSHKRKAQDFIQLHRKLKLNDDIDEEDEEDEKTQSPTAEEGGKDGEAMDEDGGEKNAEPRIKDDPDGAPPKNPKREKQDPSVLQVYTDEELSSMNRDRLVVDVTILEEKLGNAKPNLNVLPEYRRREEEYLAKAKEFEEITKHRDEQKAKYEELRKQRLDEFMTGFNMISSKLKEMYQMITLGGNAELDLVDTMDPFSEGVNFSVMPPKKSWKNISNLSGGEKTLSSLALVFALHVFKPTPLYFMDEIDAALDFRNVSIVANYIKDRTKDAQFIIISLRNDMFELSHRLVGIYKTNNATRSICIDNKPIVPIVPASTQNGLTEA